MDSEDPTSRPNPLGELLRTREGMLAGGLSFLSNRELALGIWLIVGLTWAFARREVRESFGYVVRAFLHPKVSGVVLAAAAYTAGAVFLLRGASFWDGSMLKDTVIWFIGTAFIALMNTEKKDSRFFRRVVDDGLKVVVLVEFVANLYVFPIYVELVLVPVVFFMVMMLAVAETKAELAPAKAFLERLLTVTGVVVLAFSIEHIVSDWNHVVTAATVRTLLLPPALTIMFVPFLYLFALISAYELVFMRVDFALKHEDKRLAKETKRRILKTAGASLARVNLFASDFGPQLFGTMTRADAHRVLDQFAAAMDRRRRAKIATQP
jgi:hypothetical protein